MRVHRLLTAAVVWVLSAGTVSLAAGHGGFVPMPYSAADNAGNQWFIYQNGMLQQRGNQPVFLQGATMVIGGDQVQFGANRPHLDDQSGELIFENGTAGGMSITRRVLVKTDESYVRYIDVLHNPTQQDQSVDVQLQSRVNFQLTGSQTVADPHGKDRLLGWVGQTQMNRAAVEIFAGPAGKNSFTVPPQQEQNLIQIEMTVKVPAGKDIAIMHVYMTAASMAEGAQAVENLKESALLKTVAPAIRRILVNFGAGPSLAGDAQVLRGDLLDAVELHGGDQLNGTLKETSYTLHAFYGDIQLPAERVIGLINIGEFHPRQLVVTSDGQIFGGELAKSTIAIALSSGQVTQVPLAQISRVGYRKLEGEAGDDVDESSADGASSHSTVFLRAGDRLSVLPPAEPIDFVTRYGILKLDPKSINSLSFQSDENPVNTAYLTDGSHVAGLVADAQLKMTLAPTASATQPSEGQPQALVVPTSAMMRWQFNAKPAEAGDDRPTLKLINGDEFVGSLTGQLKLDTRFDTITINASEIRSLAHIRDSGDVQITLWDQSHLSGSLEEPEATCLLDCGQTIAAPLALVESYTQPQPTISETMTQQIKSIVANLAADDWKQRDAAQGQLVAMGPTIAGVLKPMLAAQPPEAQQRLQAVLKQFADQKKSGGSDAAVGGGNTGANE